MLTSQSITRRTGDDGFTLIEIMVVVLIIAILLAIAIPTYLGSRGRADSRAAESSLRNTLAAEQTYFSSNSIFADASSQPSIALTEPALTWQAGETSGPAPNTVTVAVGTNSAPSDSVYLQVQGHDGRCYEILQTNGSVPAGGHATAFSVSTPSVGQCTTPVVMNGSSSFPTIHDGSASDHADGGFYSTW